MKKRLLGLLLAILVVVGTIPFAAIPASALTGYDRGYAGGKGGTGTILAHGLDVSKWQAGNIDFSAVKAAGYSYVILRCGYSGSKDAYFETFYSQAKAAGLDVGAYLYSYATTVADAYSDAQDTLSFIAGKKFEYPIYFDYEDSTQKTLSSTLSRDICLKYMDTLADAGYLVGMYTGASFASQLPMSTICAKYEYWVAHYYDYGYTSKHSTYSTTSGMYQYTDRNYVNGKGPYDANVCYKDYPSIVKTYGFNGYTASVNVGDNFYARIYNSAYNKYVDIDSNGDPIAFAKSSAKSQIWRFKRMDSGNAYKITNMQNGLNLDLYNGDATLGTNIITYPDNGQDPQRWYLNSAGDGYTFSCKSAPANAMDIDTGGQTGISCWNNYAGVNQIFRLEIITYSCELSYGDAAYLGDTFYANLYNSAYDKYVGLVDDKPTALAKSDDGSQLWKFAINKDDGTYKITNMKNGKNLDLLNEDSTPGMDIITWQDNGAGAQKWYLVPEGDGYMIQCTSAKNNALDIDVSGQESIANWDACAAVNQILQINKVGLYTVNHYTQNIDGKASSKDNDNYTLADTVLFNDEPLGEVTPSLNSYANRLAPAEVAIIPAEDGSTVVNYYYRLMYGDVNTDEVVDANDLVSLKQRLVYNSAAESELAERLSDINGDSKVSLNDVLRLKLYIADTTTNVGN